MTTTADETFGGGSKDSLTTSSSGLTSDEICEITDIALYPSAPGGASSLSTKSLWSRTTALL